MANGLIEVKKHTLQKYDILRKYFQACLKFEKIYGNFAYIDTHGGSGKVLFEGHPIAGSPLIAAESDAKPECYATEIDPEHWLQLRKAVAGLSNIKVIKRDCNKEISSLLKQIDPWKFTFCFLDPDGLVYWLGTEKVFQLTWTTIEEISKRNNSEVLINLRSQDMVRIMGAMDAEPERASKLAEDITALIGKAWNTKFTRYQIRDLFLDKLQSIGFTHVGAVNIKAEGENHQYYLVYGSHHEVGARIMSSNFKMALGLRPLFELPLRRFVYDDIPHGRRAEPESVQKKLFE